MADSSYFDPSSKRENELLMLKDKIGRIKQKDHEQLDALQHMKTTIEERIASQKKDIQKLEKVIKDSKASQTGWGSAFCGL